MISKTIISTFSFQHGQTTSYKCNELRGFGSTCNTTQITFNMVYWAPRALESASREVALKPVTKATAELHIGLRAITYAPTSIHLLLATTDKTPIPTIYGNLGSDRCLLCPQDVVGDEFHYLFSCSYFGDERNLLLKPYYIN